MPDSSGKLLQEDYARIAAWFELHWKAPAACPICDSESWVTIPHIVAIPRHAPNALAAGTETWPHILVRCNTCTYTLMFDAVRIGGSASHASLASATVVKKV